MPRPCAQPSGPISSSLTPFSATALILILRPAACAASMPAITLSRSPQRVIARNLSGSSVSSETLMRSTPHRQLAGDSGASCEPLVVSVSSSSAPLSRCRDSEAEQRHDVRAAPAARRRSAAACARPRRRPSRAGRVPPASAVPLGQEGHVLGHAIDAAEVAAVGHRHAQIGDRAPERVDQPFMKRGSPGCRPSICAGGVQLGHSFLAVIRCTPAHWKPMRPTPMP
jgi:hypothetical protein